MCCQVAITGRVQRVHRDGACARPAGGLARRVAGISIVDDQTRPAMFENPAGHIGNGIADFGRELEHRSVFGRNQVPGEGAGRQAPRPVQAEAKPVVVGIKGHHAFGPGAVVFYILLDGQCVEKLVRQEDDGCPVEIGISRRQLMFSPRRSPWTSRSTGLVSTMCRLAAARQAGTWRKARRASDIRVPRPGRARPGQRPWANPLRARVGAPQADEFAENL